MVILTLQKKAKNVGHSMVTMVMQHAVFCFEKKKKHSMGWIAINH